MELFEKPNIAKFQTNVNEAVFPVSFHEIQGEQLINYVSTQIWILSQVILKFSTGSEFSEAIQSECYLA